MTGEIEILTFVRMTEVSSHTALAAVSFLSSCRGISLFVLKTKRDPDVRQDDESNQSYRACRGISFFVLKTKQDPDVREDDESDQSYRACRGISLFVLKTKQDPDFRQDDGID
ncbi:hypothetical protein CBP12_00450 [Oceanisphaera avium]|uniref:Uncharacterized protein n=2 Tax=Oceanisphaera avium TaxID=1903694 RepID=A0A1Y0CTY9_9GAMM|nr:hypothetical protein CBP12_00450 [Oceanisphaera avium]